MRETVTSPILTHSYLAQEQTWMAKLHQYVAEMLYLGLPVQFVANQTCTAVNVSSFRFLLTDMAVILVSCKTYRLSVRILYDTTWHHEGLRWIGKKTNSLPQQRHNIELRVRHTVQQL
jgi:hypothetical protein